MPFLIILLVVAVVFLILNYVTISENKKVKNNEDVMAIYLSHESYERLDYFEKGSDCIKAVFKDETKKLLYCYSDHTEKLERVFKAYNKGFEHWIRLKPKEKKRMFSSDKNPTNKFDGVSVDFV